jgi:hypothetical protein
VGSPYAPRRSSSRTGKTHRTERRAVAPEDVKNPSATVA